MKAGPCPSQRHLARVWTAIPIRVESSCGERKSDVLAGAVGAFIGFLQMDLMAGDCLLLPVDDSNDYPRLINSQSSNERLNVFSKDIICSVM